MQTFPSVSPVYDTPCMTWTVYWTLIVCRLPTLIQPALLFDYPECLPPALILSLNSNFDSALSTLCLKLMIEFCLFELHSVLIKLHMESQIESRIAFVCSLLTGRALVWATAVWSEDRPTFPSFRAFIQRFKEVFEHPAGGKEAGEQLISHSRSSDGVARRYTQTS